MARRTLARSLPTMAAIGALGTAVGATCRVYERTTGATVGPYVASTIGIGLGGCCVYGTALGLAGTPLWLSTAAFVGSAATGSAIANWSLAARDADL